MRIQPILVDEARQRGSKLTASKSRDRFGRDRPLIDVSGVVCGDIAGDAASWFELSATMTDD